MHTSPLNAYGPLPALGGHRRTQWPLKEVSGSVTDGIYAGIRSTNNGLVPICVCNILKHDYVDFC